MQKIMPTLWFDNQGEDAAKFYTSVFKNSKITGISRYGDTGPGPAGGAMTVTFQLEGQDFMALNGGPEFKFSEAVSFLINCETQEEVDYFWDELIEGGGQPSECGWLKDRFGLSWQVVPSVLIELLSSGNAAKSQSVMGALLQ